MTIDEVAAELRVSVPTVRWLRQGGRFAPAVRVGRRLLWDRDVITDWIDQHREPTVARKTVSSTAKSPHLSFPDPRHAPTRAVRAEGFRGTGPGPHDLDQGSR